MLAVASAHPFQGICIRGNNTHGKKRRNTFNLANNVKGIATNIKVN